MIHKLMISDHNKEQDYSYYGLTLKNTCFACPEQYDVYYEDILCGYMRLRHGYFRTEYYPDSKECIFGDIVYDCEPKGKGRFMEDEREEHLKKGAKSIINKLDSKLVHGNCNKKH